MPNLVRFVLVDGSTIFSACEAPAAQSQPRVELDPSVTLTGETDVQCIPLRSVRAMLPCDSRTLVPNEARVFRFASIGL